MIQNLITLAGVRRRLVLPFACGILASGVAHAQDTYWGMANEQVFNSQTRAVTTNPATGVAMYLEYQGQGAKAVFDGAGNVLFAVNNSSLNFNGVDQGSYYGFGQVMAIPGKCRRYNAWRLSGSINHTVNLYVTQIDASMVTTNGSTSLAPVFTSNTFLGNCSDSYAGAVAAPLNPDGTRYLYFLINNGGMGGFWFQLYRYTIAADGTPNTTPTLVKDSLPADYVSTTTANRIMMDISQDGQTIAYKKCNGKLVTYRLDGTGGAPTQYPDVPLGLEQATTTTGERRWFFSTGSALKFYVEGNTTATTVSTGGIGSNSELALGRDGNMYTAKTDGELVHFWPGINPIFVFPYFSTGVYVPSTQGSSNYFYFGSHVVRDDMNFYSATTFGTPAVKINGDSGSGTLNVLDCLPMMLVNASTTVSPYYKIRIKEIVGSSSIQRDSTALLYGTFDSVDVRYLSTLSGLANNYLSNHLGVFDVIVEYGSVCGAQPISRRISITSGPVASMGIRTNYKRKASPTSAVTSHSYPILSFAPNDPNIPTTPANPQIVGRNSTSFDFLSNTGVTLPGQACSLTTHIDYWNRSTSTWKNDTIPATVYGDDCTMPLLPNIPLSDFVDTPSYNSWFQSVPDSTIARLRVDLKNQCGTITRAVVFRVVNVKFPNAYTRESTNGIAGHSVLFAPVPFGSKVSAVLQLAEEAKVSMRILSIDGRTVARPLQDELMHEGTTSVDIVSADWPAGVYFYECSINGEHFTGKLIKQ